MAEGLLLPSSLLPSRGALRPNTCSVAEHKRGWPRTWLICRAEELSSSSPKAYLAEQNFVLAGLNICRALGGLRHYCRAEEIKAGHSFLPNICSWLNWSRQPLFFVRLIIVWLCRTENIICRTHVCPKTKEIGLSLPKAY